MLAPWQRIDALKAFFYPSTVHLQRLGAFPKTDWARVDKIMRPELKKILYLPQEASGGISIRFDTNRVLWYPYPGGGFGHRRGRQRLQVSHLAGPVSGGGCVRTRGGGHQAANIKGPLHPRSRRLPVRRGRRCVPGGPGHWCRECVVEGVERLKTTGSQMVVGRCPLDFTCWYGDGRKAEAGGHENRT